MPIVHQDHGFDFDIKAEDIEPPKVHVIGAGFKTIDLGLYMRLASWSHTGGVGQGR